MFWDITSSGEHMNNSWSGTASRLTEKGGGHVDKQNKLEKLKIKEILKSLGRGMPHGAQSKREK